MTLIAGMFVFASIQTVQVVPQSTAALSYHGKVDVYKNSELVDSSDNVFFEAGANMFKDILWASHTDATYNTSIQNISRIALCNSSANDNLCESQTNKDASDAFTAFEGCGLDNATGTYYVLGGNGNWSIQYTFTSSCDGLHVNATRLQNETDDLFAGNDFTHTAIDSTDTLTVNWTIWIS